MGNRALRRREQQPPEDVGTLWTLRRFEGNARCALMARPNSWELRVIVDGTTLLSEHCLRAEDAFSLAERWKERMLRDGWQQVLPKGHSRGPLGAPQSRPV
jgi:hypothetical protein